MHTRPNVYMDEVLLGAKTVAKFHNNQLYHQSATSINDQQNNMRNRQRKWRVLLSIGLLLPALAAIIGIVAWTISIEVASANEAMSSQKSQNHQNHHQHHPHSHSHSHSHSHPHQHHLQHSHQTQQQQQPSNQNEQQQANKRNQQQQPSIALPQQAAETKSESQACATLVLTNLKQQLDSNSDNIENRASKVVSTDNDDSSSYETDEQQQPATAERDEAAKPVAVAADQSKPASSHRQVTQQQQRQQDDESSYEAIASAISTTLNAGSNLPPAEPLSSSALKSSAADSSPVKRTNGENVADVIDHLVLRRRQTSTQKGRPNMRASRIVVVAPSLDDSMKARSLTKQVEASSGSEKVKERTDRVEPISEPSSSAATNEEEEEATAERDNSSSNSDENDRQTGSERRSSSLSESQAENEPELEPEVVEEPANVDRDDWVPAWPLRRHIQQASNSDDGLSIHVSSQPKEARARSRRQEINPSMAFERIASLTKQRKASSATNQSPQQQQQQVKLYSTEQIIRDHVMKSKSRSNSSQPVGEANEKQQMEQQLQVEQNKMLMSSPAALPQQQQPQQPKQQQQPQPQPQDGSRQQQHYQQEQPNGLWQQHQLARLAESHSFRPQQKQFLDMIASSSSSSNNQLQQQQQVPQFFFQPNNQFNPLANINNNHHHHNQNHAIHHPHLQQQHHNLLQTQQQQPAIHTTEHHFLLSPSQFQNFMNSPLFQQQVSRRQQLARSSSVDPAVALPAGGMANNKLQPGASLEPSGAMRAMRSLATSQVQQHGQFGVDQEAQGSEMRSMRYLTNGAPMAGADGLVISEQEAAAALASAGPEPRPQMVAGQQHQRQHSSAAVEGPALDQEVQESYGQMPAYQMAEGGYGSGGQQYHHGGGGGGGYGSDNQDKKSKGITFHFGGGPIGGGTQLITSPMGIFKHLMIPLLPNPRVNLNGKVVFGVVLEKSTAFGSPASKKRKYKFWGR